jgi:predicted amidophosphoribosyltransferase
MDPTSILFALVVVIVGLCVAANQLKIEPTRSCPQCDEDVPLGARACRACHYRFS